MELNTLIYLALMIFSGMAFGRLAKHCKLPNVTGYLVAGLLLGPVASLFLGEYVPFPENIVSQMGIISDVALGFIALTVGGEFKISYFKRVGATPIVIAVFESLFAIICVFVGLVIARQPMPFALSLAAISAATAPAATIMVVKQYRAKGPVTETLLSVVALDDATALIFFSLAISAAKIFMGGEVSLASSLLSPMYEIFGSIIIGFILGLIFIIPLRFFKKDGNRLSLIIGFTFAGIGISQLCGFSELLFCMAMGSAIANFSKESNDILRLIDGLTPPIFMLFFVLSGADLNIKVLPTIGIVGVIYVVMRVIGKVSGAWFGATIRHTDKTVRRWLGPALIPQAGVAIGLSLAATQILPYEYGSKVRAVILCATLIYELVGPAIAKFSLTKAKEISPQ